MVLEKCCEIRDREYSLLPSGIWLDAITASLAVLKSANRIMNQISLFNWRIRLYFLVGLNQFGYNSDALIESGFWRQIENEDFTRK
jgi:hypothetical protein